MDRKPRAQSILYGMDELVALIDLGSNAVRFVSARLRLGVGFDILEQERVQTRLGGGHNGLLCESAVEQTSQVTQRFLAHVRRNADPRVLAIATAAIRDAPNRDLLLSSLRQRSALEVRVLSVAEEGELGAEAALRELPGLRDGLVADLGGGSLQVTPVRGGELGPVTSMPLGATRLNRRFLAHNPPTAQELSQLRCEVIACMRQALPRTPRTETLVVLGGTPRAILRYQRRVDASAPADRPLASTTALHRSELESVRTHLEQLSVSARQQLPFIDSQRADVMVSAAIILEELLQLTDCSAFTVCATSVREGLLWREAGSPPQPLHEASRSCYSTKLPRPGAPTVSPGTSQPSAYAPMGSQGRPATHNWCSSKNDV